MSPTQRDYDALKREVQSLREGLQRRPILVPQATGAEPVNILEIIDGNTVYNSGGITLYGITRAGGTKTSVASAYDPNSVASTPGLFSAEAGIGRAKLYIGGTLQASLVLVVHDNRATSLIPFALVNTDKPISVTTVSLLVGAGPTTVTAYTTLFI